MQLTLRLRRHLLSDLSSESSDLLVETLTSHRRVLGVPHGSYQRLCLCGGKLRRGGGRGGGGGWVGGEREMDMYRHVQYIYKHALLKA